MRLYLAHNLGEREAIRSWELNIENKYNIELINPFYDTKKHREDIKILDEMKGKPAAQKDYLNSRTEGYCKRIVEKDLSLIRQSDGLLALVTKSIGTSMEIIMAFRVFNIPVYIITSEYDHHPWIVANSTRIFKTKEEFEEEICRT